MHGCHTCATCYPRLTVFAPRARAVSTGTTAAARLEDAGDARADGVDDAAEARADGVEALLHRVGQRIAHVTHARKQRAHRGVGACGGCGVVARRRGAASVSARATADAHANARAGRTGWARALASNSVAGSTGWEEARRNAHGRDCCMTWTRIVTHTTLLSCTYRSRLALAAAARQRASASSSRHRLWPVARANARDLFFSTRRPFSCSSHQ